MDWLIFSVISLFIAWIWVDYYRLIDIYRPNHLKYFLFSFVLGCLSVFVVWGLNDYVLDYTHFEQNDQFVNDFLFCVFRIGAVEELAKIIPLGLCYLIFRKEFKEPIDYLAFACTAALGFAAIENALYFKNHGPDIIDGRAILSTVSHMFNTGLMAYGIILYKFKPGQYNKWVIALYFLFSAISHGVYDFWLMFNPAQPYGFMLTILYFLITVSLFSTILNNSLNQSSFFSYKHVIDSKKVTNQLLLYYAIVFIAQSVFVWFENSFVEGVLNLYKSALTTGPIVLITTIRLGRFKLIRNRWNPLRLELPFYIFKGSPFEQNRGLMNIQIKGEAYNEVHVNAFYNEYFGLKPMTQRRTYIERTRIAYIEDKLFLKYDQTFYLARIYDDGIDGTHESVLLKPKTTGTTQMNDGSPIVALLKFDGLDPTNDFTLEAKDFAFLEWGILKVLPQSEILPNSKSDIIAELPDATE